MTFPKISKKWCGTLIPPIIERIARYIQPKIKKAIGKFKDELNGNVLIESIALRPKCYADEAYGGGVAKKAKSVKIFVVNEDLYCDDYKIVLEDRKDVIRNQGTIVSKKSRHIY